MKTFKTNTFLNITFPVITLVITSVVFFLNPRYNYKYVILGDIGALFFIYLVNVIGGASIIQITKEKIILSNPLVFWAGSQSLLIKDIKVIKLVKNSYISNFGIHIILYNGYDKMLELPDEQFEAFYEELVSKKINVQKKD